MANTRDAGVIGRGNRIAFWLMKHSSELTDFERFAIFADALLHKENRTFWVDFDKDTNDKQRQKQHYKPYTCHETVEAPLEEKPYFVIIFLHAA